MYAATETDLTDGAAGDVAIVRTFPVPRVTVGGTEEHQHLLPFADRNTAELDRTGGGTEEGLHRGLVAHRLLECGPRQRWLGTQQGELLRETGKAIDRGANTADCGVDTSRQQRPCHDRRFLLGQLAGVA